MLITWNSSGKENIQSLSIGPPQEGSEISLTPKKTKVPPAMKRRLTPLGRLVLDRLYDAVDFLNFQNISSNIPWVMSSRHGDADRVGRLLTDISENEMLSPMDFSQSVHNAIAGAFSIATKNTSLHTALSGGTQSFEMGLLEAYAIQKNTGGHVGYAFYDTAMPEPYNAVIPGNAEAKDTCLVMVLGPEEKEITNGVRLTYSSGEMPEDIALSPLDNTTHFFNHPTKSLSIKIPGGHFSLERLA